MADGSGSGDAALPVAGAARRLGGAPTTLRTRERRSGTGPTGRAEGTRRRYTPADVEQLVRMRALVLNGVAPADAARVAQFSRADQSSRDDQSSGVRPGGRGGPGGRVLAVGRGAGPRERGLARAAAALDSTASASV